MVARKCWFALGVIMVIINTVTSNQTNDPNDREWVKQTQGKWLRGVQNISLRFVLECDESSIKEQIEPVLRNNTIRELKNCGIAILPASQQQQAIILPVLRISLIMNQDPLRRQRYYYCAALVEHIEPCSLFRTKDIAMANCWSSGPVLIGGRVEDIIRRIDLCVREYAKAVMQTNTQE